MRSHWSFIPSISTRIPYHLRIRFCDTSNLLMANKRKKWCKISQPSDRIRKTRFPIHIVHFPVHIETLSVNLTFNYCAKRLINPCQGSVQLAQLYRVLYASNIQFDSGCCLPSDCSRIRTKSSFELR